MSKRYNDVSGQTYIKAARRFNKVRYPRRGAGLAIVIIVMLATLACGFLRAGPTSAPNRVVIRVQLPTLTATHIPNLMSTDASTFVTPTTPAEPATTLTTPIASSPALAAIPAESIQKQDTPAAITLSNTVTPVTPLATDTAKAAQPNITPASTILAVESPPPANSSAPTATPVPENRDWTFDNLGQVSEEDSLVISGKAINNTGLAQQLNFITGIFYDAQGQVIAGTEIVDAYWPVEVVPSGGSLPFELTVDGVRDPANFKLGVEAVPSDQNPRQDFELFDLKQSNENGKYCITGQIRNLGKAVQEYLVIVVILYDSQGNIVNFSPFQEPDFEYLMGDQTLEVDICIGLSDPNVADYDLWAWGQ